MRRSPLLRAALAVTGSTALAAGSLAALAVTGGAGAALAAGPGPSCSAGTCTVTFATVGTGQSFTVPQGVSSLSVTLYGGAGGGSNGAGGSGGDGAQVTAALAVTPGQALGVDVGGAGRNGFNGGAGGVNGGGAGAQDLGGGGGGATDITSGGTDQLVAGGGGGGTPNFGPVFGTCSGARWLTTGGAGGNADHPGQPGQSGSDGGLTLAGGGGGAAGTTSGAGGGGTGGTATGSNACGSGSTGTAGASGSGMTGGSAPGTSGAGGGGGGYYGGGSGGGGGFEASSVFVDAAGGGAGGGSSYTGGAAASPAPVIDDTGNNGSVNGGNGEAVLSWTDPISTGTATYSATAGQELTVAAPGLLGSATGPGDTLTASGPANGATAAGGTVTVNTDGSFTYTPPSDFAGSDSFSYTVTDGTDYATGIASIAVGQAVTATGPVSAPAAGTAGTAIPASAISATLLSASSPASGTITFTVFGPQNSAPTDCSSGGTTVGAAAVTGPGAYSPPGAGFTPATAGTYWWYASYGGDTANTSSASPCGTAMTSTVVTLPPPDLSLVTTGSPNPVISGHRLTYTITVTNTGGQTATGVTVKDTLPASVHFRSASATQGTCTRLAKARGGTVTCSIGNLAGSGTAIVTIRVLATRPGTLTDTATVTAASVTPDSDDSATATGTVNGG